MGCTGKRPNFSGMGSTSSCGLTSLENGPIFPRNGVNFGRGRPNYAEEGLNQTGFIGKVRLLTDGAERCILWSKQVLDGRHGYGYM